MTCRPSPGSSTATTSPSATVSASSPVRAPRRRTTTPQLADWLALLHDEGLLSASPSEIMRALADGSTAYDAQVVTALHAFLDRTPARLKGISLADAVGERRTQNQPGTTDEYPNWRIPLADADGRPVLLEDLGAAFVDPNLRPGRR